MAIFYPDVSNLQGAMPLQAGTLAVCAKVSEGTTFTDPDYQHYKSAAASIGALFSAYHFLHQGNGYAQGQYAGRLSGAGVPIMVDSEPVTGSNPTVQDNLDFKSGYNSVNPGKVWGSYFPAWYSGSTSLVPLKNAGLALVASGYPSSGYSDSASQWNAYGGVSPTIWQYTDSQSYSGKSIDFNAFKGTVAQLAQLWGLGPSPSPSPTLLKADEVNMMILRVSDGTNLTNWAVSGGAVWEIADGNSLAGYLHCNGAALTLVGLDGAGNNTGWYVSTAELAAIQAAASANTTALNAATAQLVAAIKAITVSAGGAAPAAGNLTVSLSGTATPNPS